VQYNSNIAPFEVFTLKNVARLRKLTEAIRAGISTALSLVDVE
jgi:hypothetical protein